MSGCEQKLEHEFSRTKRSFMFRGRKLPDLKHGLLSNIVLKIFDAPNNIY